MKAKSLLFGFVVVLLMWPGFGKAQQGDSKAGKAIFDKQCSTCHGPDGTGKEAIAKALKVEMRPLGSKEVQATTDAELRKGILEGNGKMRPIKLPNEKDANDVVAFLRTLAKR